MIQTNYQEFLEQKLFLYLLSRKSKILISWNLPQEMSMSPYMAKGTLRILLRILSWENHCGLSRWA